MNGSLRDQDMQGERIVNKFLQKYFYERLKNNGTLKNFIAVDLKENQLSGIDMILEGDNGHKFYIDEKCALKYINQDLPTFAFELQWKHDNQIVDGWFINDQLKTQYYFLMWLKGKPKYDEDGNELRSYDYISKMSINDITEIELMTLSKKELRSYLEKAVALTPYNMIAQCQKMREDSIDKYTINSQIKYVFSDYLFEAPINLVIRKELLYKLSHSSYCITPQKLIRTSI